MGIRKIAKLFDNNSVSVSGPKGKGKDMLIANVIARRKAKAYISNVDYKIKGKRHINFNPNLLRIGNNFWNFIENRIQPYYYPYQDGIDIYISDCGVYFPSQYNGELDKNFKDIPTFTALSRQLGNCYIHTNQQAFSRTWNKLREQQDVFLRCEWCKVLFGKIVVQLVREYELYESAERNVPPFRMLTPLNAERKQNVQLEKQRYVNTYGKVKNHLLIYVNKSNYDTRIFKTLLEGGNEE